MEKTMALMETLISAISPPRTPDRQVRVLVVSLLESRCSDLHHLDRLRVNWSTGCVFVVPVPPLIRWCLWVTRGRVLPLLLAAERSHVEVVPGAPRRLVATAVDEVSAEHAVAIAEKYVVTVPFIDAEVRIEAVEDGVPGHLPVHPRFQPRDVRLRGAGGEHKGGVAGVQMSEVGDLVGQHGAAPAGMLRPAENPGLEKGAIDDQLRTALEQIEQTYLSTGSIELVLLAHRQPGHPPALGSHCVASAGQLLLLDQQLLARSLPLLRRHDRGRLHVVPDVFIVVHVSLLPPGSCWCLSLPGSCCGACLRPTQRCRSPS